ncbi:hypothetical protein ACQPX6_18750 [Actinomycetospora sp. CA-101289]|uniref:hypothetical protein n=1 Tax=Actinomycetospora sp. CA-101289 TaxID=3239893 RepID=UPI003D9572EE
MDPVIRPLEARDLAPLVDLALRVWAPVFASIERQLAGSGVFERQHPDGRADQRAVVVETGGDPGHEPARRLYEECGFTALPVVRYFTTL